MCATLLSPLCVCVCSVHSVALVLWYSDLRMPPRPKRGNKAAMARLLAAAHAAREARREEVKSGILPPPPPSVSGSEFDKVVFEKITEELPSKRPIKPFQKFTIAIKPPRSRKETRRLRKEAELAEKARVKLEKAEAAAAALEQTAAVLERRAFLKVT